MTRRKFTTSGAVPTLPMLSSSADAGRALGASASLDAVSSAFVHARVRVTRHLRELTDAHEQALAFEMEVATQHLAAAAADLTAAMHAVAARKARLEMQVRAMRYECLALREVIADLFTTCLRPSGESASTPWPNAVCLADSYPWLRRSLEHCAAVIADMLARCGSDTDKNIEPREVP
jgi:hypothetical protein